MCMGTYTLGLFVDGHFGSGCQPTGHECLYIEVPPSSDHNDSETKQIG